MGSKGDLKSKFLGGMVGSALGDAIGELAFSTPQEAELRTVVARQEKLIYTDDTAMAIGLAESLIQVGHLDWQHLGDTFRANYEQEPWRGYASGPPTIFTLTKKHDLTYTEVARSLFGGQGSFGNGAAMRIAPVGLFFHNTPDLYIQASSSALVTHAHPIGQDGAAVLALAIAQAVKLKPANSFPLNSFSQALIDFARTPELEDKMRQVKNLILAEAPPAQAADQLGRSVAMHESMPFAVYAFLRHPHSFESCLFEAVLNGGDRDTLGAMACAISGAYLGLEVIPQDWREKLENRQHIEELASKLAEMSGKN